MTLSDPEGHFACDLTSACKSFLSVSEKNSHRLFQGQWIPGIHGKSLIKNSRWSSAVDTLT